MSAFIDCADAATGEASNNKGAKRTIDIDEKPFLTDDHQEGFGMNVALTRG
jgi:hypothetical protein